VDVAEQLHDARRKVEDLDRAMRLLSNQIQHQESAVGAALARELEPELSRITSRIRDAVVELVASTRELMAIEAETNAKGYSMPISGYFTNASMPTPSDVIENSENWLVNNWRDVARGLGLPRGPDAKESEYMRLEAEYQKQCQKAVTSGRFKQRWSEFLAEKRARAAA
jgi:hypothetical protein